MADPGTPDPLIYGTGDDSTVTTSPSSYNPGLEIGKTVAIVVSGLLFVALVFAPFIWCMCCQNRSMHQLFRRRRQGEERVGTKRTGFFGKLKKAFRQSQKSRDVGPSLPQNLSVREREEDEERLVGDEVEMKNQNKPLSRRSTWGSEAPPAYSAIALGDDNDSHLSEVH